ncbi:tyrosine-type recombinase/integrase [Falsiroseomonas sp. HC035]|uniref:tyrosine-type recombinase/integrase n=1 Tax=Falsiroseomonas sp. HC035 TaxID=3390999 RepID=UPI003D31412D
MADFIEMHGRSYRAVWDVPADCRSTFGGSRRLKVPLHTDREREARIRAKALVDGWKAQCEGARGQGDVVAARAAFLRQQLQLARNSDERRGVLEAIAEAANDIDPGPEDGSHAEEDWRPEAERFYSLATGARTELKPMVEPWLMARAVAERTKVMDRATLMLLCRHHRTAQEVDRRAATRFVEAVLMPGRKPATVARMLSSLMGFWEWLQDRGELPDSQRSPWANQRPSQARQEASQERRPFTEAEASAFVDAVRSRAKVHPVDYIVVMLMAVTGARLEEMAALTSGDIAVGEGVVWVKIRAGKTRSARRRIPVVAAPLLEALSVRLSVDASQPLFPELSSDRFGKVSQPMSKRLGRLLRVSVKDKAVVAAHSWRHRGRTLAEQSDIPAEIADYFFGHKRPGEGLGRYSHGPSDEQLLRVARAVPLPYVSMAGLAPLGRPWGPAEATAATLRADLMSLCIEPPVAS